MSTQLDGGRRAVARVLSAAGLVAGAALLLAPAAVVGAVASGFPRQQLWVARVLGARLLAQHTMVLARPGPRTLRLAAAVDELHAVSMLPALAVPRYRRAALVSGGLAAGYVLAGRSLAGSPRR